MKGAQTKCISKHFRKYMQNKQRPTERTNKQGKCVFYVNAFHVRPNALFVWMMNHTFRIKSIGKKNTNERTPFVFVSPVGDEDVFMKRFTVTTMLYVLVYCVFTFCSFSSFSGFLFLHFLVITWFQEFLFHFCTV